MSSQEEAKINVNHKDTLFQLVFGKEENKRNLLELYNAITGSDYDNIDDLTINTLEKAIYMNMKNDVSCIIDARMALFEHQSTFNPNMPLRGFFYFASLYHDYVDSLTDIDIYSNRLITIPTPQYVVLYNGTDKNIEDKMTLKLSDAFKHEDKTKGFEWTATMININVGHSQQLMEKCEALKGYSMFVHKVRTHTNELGNFEAGFEKAVDECIKEGYLAEILKKSRAEVHKVCLYEFDQEKHDKITFNDGYKNGEIAGYKNGEIAGYKNGEIAERRKTVERLLSKGYTREQIMDITGYENELINSIIQ